MRTPFQTLLVALLTFVVALFGVATPAFAAPPAPPAPAASSSSSSSSASPGDQDLADQPEMVDPTLGLPWQEGPKAITLGQNVKLALPEARRFLAQPDAGRLMEKFGNLHNENLLGVVLPTSADDDWMVTIRYDAEGYIKDDETLDGKEILASIREGEPAYNEERKKLGFPAIHADGWTEDPRYDKGNHFVLWALSVSSERGTSVNLNTRILGRNGFVSVNLVTGKDSLTTYRPIGSEILRATSFDAGHRYEDFNASTDKVAEYGLTGLVLGGAGIGLAKAAKIGLLASCWKWILAALLAGKKAIVVLLAGGAAFLKKVFGGKKAKPAEEEDPEGDAPST